MPFRRLKLRKNRSGSRAAAVRRTESPPIMRTRPRRSGIGPPPSLYPQLPLPGHHDAGYGLARTTCQPALSEVCAWQRRPDEMPCRWAPSLPANRPTWRRRRLLQALKYPAAAELGKRTARNRRPAGHSQWRDRGAPPVPPFQHRGQMTLRPVTSRSRNRRSLAAVPVAVVPDFPYAHHCAIDSAGRSPAGDVPEPRLHVHMHMV